MSSPGTAFARFRAWVHGPLGGRVPLVRQLQAVDCGAACLAMVLRHHGHEAGIEDVRGHLATGPDGASALDILRAARAFGLRGRGLRVEIEHLSHLKAGTILHWQLRHFVVLERTTARGAWIADPAAGRRFVTTRELTSSFTGVALELEPTPEFQRVRRPVRRAWLGLLKGRRRAALLSRIVVTSLFVQVVTLAVPIFTGALVDQVVPRSDARLLVVLCAGALALAVFSFVSQIVRGHTLLALRMELDLQLSGDLVDHLSRLPYSYFQSRETGDLMLRLNSTASIREIVTAGAVSAILDGALVMGYLAALLFISPTMGLIVLGLSALRLGVFLVTRGPNARLLSDGLQAQAATSGHLIQMLQNMETLKAAGVEARSVETWSHLYARLMNLAIARGRLGVVSDACLAVLATISPVVVLGYGGFLVLGGTLSLGSMLAMSALSAGVFGPLGSLTATALQWQLLGGYFERIEDVLKTPVEQPAGRALRQPRLEGGIRLEGVTFEYSKARGPVVRDVSLDIAPGRRLAIVGPSGSGKSTLARLILGLYPPSAGVVRLDGWPLEECDRVSVRSQIGFVPQQPHFFDASIRENIALFAPEATHDEILEAARLAALHDEVACMPLGYETLVGEGGGTISGGQRQRIAIARALLRRPRILILDEATSNLDGTLERRVHENIARVPCTCVIIAHRLSTVANADAILVMRGGAIAESGSHRDLLEKDGLYAQLVADQSRSAR